MRNQIINTKVTDGTTTTFTYKGEIIPYFDLQMLLISICFGLGLFLILNFYNSNDKKKNLFSTIFATVLFILLFWWISLPEQIFYNLLRL
jgi:hypothetical protein